MPQMADVVVKKADNTTNVTYVAKVPSSGDKVSCVWAQDAASVYRNQRPVVAALTQWNGNRTARRERITFDWPVVRTINGSPEVVHRIPFEVAGAMPSGVTDAEATEAVAQFTNFLSSPLMRTILGEGYAAT